MNDQRLSLCQPAAYEITVQGWLTDRWAGWFGDMTIACTGGGERPAVTRLTGLVDQAALLGLLQRLYTLGLPLVSVRRIGEALNEGGHHDRQDS